VDRKTTINVIYAMLAVLGLLAVQAFIERAQEVERVEYSTFRQYLEQRRVDDLRVTEERITGEFVDPDEGDPTSFVTARVDPDFARQLEEAGVEFTGGSDDSVIGTIASWVLPILLFFGLWFFVVTRLANRMGGAGMMSIGKSKAKIYVEQDTGTSFADVAGVDVLPERRLTQPVPLRSQQHQPYSSSKSCFKYSGVQPRSVPKTVVWALSAPHDCA